MISRNLRSGKCLRTFEGHQGWVASVVFASQNRFITGSGDKTVKLWDLDSGNCLQTYKGHSDIVRCITIIDDDRFVTASDGEPIILCLFL